MYIWVVVATFITILYSFNMSVRADLDRTHAESRAGVVVTKFTAQHNALREYFNSQARAKTGDTAVSYYPGNGYNLPEGETSIESAKIEGFLPHGYTDDPAVTTRVICLEEDKPEASNCTYSVDGSCCTDEGVAIYVVSYREIPSRWVNKVTFLPSADLLGAMAKAPGFGKRFGYTEYVDGKLMLSGGRMVQDYDEEGNKEGDPYFEQQEIFHEIQNYPEFSKCLNEKVHCLYAFQRIYG